MITFKQYISEARKLKPVSGYADRLMAPTKYIEQYPELKYISANVWTHLANLALKNGVEQEHKISDLYSTQRHVMDVVLNPNVKHKTKNNILVVVLNGFKVVVDGNHRISIAYLNGDSKISAKTLDFGKVAIGKDYNSINRMNSKLLKI
jgi:hypothetical protein